MAETYKLKTALDAKIPYDHIEVEVIKAVKPETRIITVLEVKNKIADKKNSISILQTEITALNKQLLLVETEAKKVTTAIL